MNSKYVKGTKWALSNVATCAAALSFLIVTNSTLADTTTDGQVSQDNVKTAEVQPATANNDSAVTVENATQNVEANSSTQNTDNVAQGQNVAKTQASTQPVATVANDEVPDGGSVYDDYPDAANNPLGVAAYFHIFSNDATLNAHTNGNLAVKNLDGNVNFGTNIHEELLDKEISYIQNITKIANSSFVSAGDTRTNKVIFGEGVNINVSNPNRVNVNNTDIDHLTSAETYQDKNGNYYIDFAKEFQNLADKSTNFANAPTPNETITNSNFDDMNNRVIDVSDYVVNEKNQIILNLDPEVLKSNTPLQIKGVSSDEKGPTIIINVDTAGDPNYSVNSPIKIQYDDGSDRDSQETEYFGDNHLLWNFIDSTASDKLYHGTINMEAVVQGSVLAPKATINVNHNLDGNIVADKVNVNAETHRWDLQDTTKEDDYDLPNVDLPEVELPSVEEPEPEDPDPEEPENPDIENPDVEEPENPDTENPDVEEPENPDTENPDVEEPENPDTENPDVETPDVEEPETPDTENPDVETPDVQEPDVDESTDDEEGEGDTGLIDVPTDNKDNETSKDKTEAGNDLVPDVAYQDSNKQGTLPQTSNSNSLILTAVGLALAAGLAFVIRRKRD
ncbi:collagen-binding domain-containing protein [Companilactobacillus ginsenosidimutans]|uniref:collagen-binding domain-containing protein n=1 Tax=Companilactobacillus ginsenosidimutans TaxID=1007676 RepID=UPI00069EA470|nr:collagen-binding domain-containing protein [Companilactobacillus ginsenosidimutans]